ncbi:hypothetical protein [Treponema sp.]|uniref:hypothetical protein n=1 Tax=Treponema sp. TaxID=166 RepID=UPI00298E6FDA|nr:hypothetical protein [Treponema sp.]MCQ2242438.1 hypothetical protein [Treponema sp.]
MISLDQVLLLQEKVESAVEKITSLTERIAQLESDNDALNRKCLELTKALEEKTEFVSTLETAQDKIEESILMTINRLDSVEDALLGNDAESGEFAAENSDDETVAAPTLSMAEETESVSDENQPEEPEITVPAVSETAQSADEPFVYEQEESTQENTGLLHKSEQTVSQSMEQPNVFETTEEEPEEDDSPAPSALDGQFDIF